MDGSAFPFGLVTGHSAKLVVNLPAQLERVACDFVTLFLGSLVAFAIEPILSICSQIGLCSRPALLLICWAPWGSSSEIILLTLSGWVEKQRAAEDRRKNRSPSEQARIDAHMARLRGLAADKRKAATAAEPGTPAAEPGAPAAVTPNSKGAEPRDTPADKAKRAPRVRSRPQGEALLKRQLEGTAKAEPESQTQPLDSQPATHAPPVAMGGDLGPAVPKRRRAGPRFSWSPTSAGPLATAPAPEKPADAPEQPAAADAIKQWVAEFRAGVGGSVPSRTLHHTNAKSSVVCLGCVHIPLEMLLARYALGVLWYMPCLCSLIMGGV